MEEKDRIRIVVSRAVVKVEADLGQTKRITRKKQDRANKTRTWERQGRERHDRTMPKKDVGELYKVGQVNMWMHRLPL